VDVANRYPSAVWVNVEFSKATRGFCSGAIIARRLILTAGHCVCQRRILSETGGSHSLIDGSACAETATVKTVVYNPGETRVGAASSHGAYQQGIVRPHPELRVLLDAQGQVMSSHADLALIHLEEPLDKEFMPVPLADKELQLRESVVIVGSGYDEAAGVYDAERRHSRTTVTELLPSGGGRMRLEQPGGHHYRGDSGGPCLREGSEGTVLVGISSRNLGEGGTLTSIYPYRDWLLGEIQRAKSTKPAPRPK
jgi:hypothetical protein